MTTNRPQEEAEPSLTHDVLQAARYSLGRRPVVLTVAGLMLVVGLVLNWGWLAAAGITPFLIGVLPCLVMCALGLCMNKAGGASCSKTAGGTGMQTPPGQAALHVSAPEKLPGARMAASDHAAALRPEPRSQGNEGKD